MLASGCVHAPLARRTWALQDSRQRGGPGGARLAAAGRVSLAGLLGGALTGLAAVRRPLPGALVGLVSLGHGCWAWLCALTGWWLMLPGGLTLKCSRLRAPCSWLAAANRALIAALMAVQRLTGALSTQCCKVNDLLVLQRPTASQSVCSFAAPGAKLAQQLSSAAQASSVRLLAAGSSLP